jgi:Lipase (class 3)
MGLLYAADLHVHRPDLASRLGGVYLFGTPRIGDVRFGHFVESAFPTSVIRVTNAAGGHPQ